LIKSVTILIKLHTGLSMYTKSKQVQINRPCV
jgi:hypothetical protein